MDPPPRPHARAEASILGRTVTMLTPDYQRHWPAYFDAVADQPPRDTLLRALRSFDPTTPGPLLALDLACGSGRDTLAILAHAGPRFRVIAVDDHPEAIARTQQAVPFDDLARLMLCHCSMEALPLAGPHGQTIPPALDLVNASFALPFCAPEAFPALWTFLVDRLKPGGRFAGQFFGVRDSWATVRPASHHTRQHVLTLLQPFVILHMEEVEKDGSDAMGGTKHHHVYHVVARKL